MNSYGATCSEFSQRGCKMDSRGGPMCIKVIDICVGKSIQVSAGACFAIWEAVRERWDARSLFHAPAGFIWPPAAQSGREHKCVWLVASAIHGAQHKTLAKTRLSLRFISQQRREKRKKLPSSLLLSCLPLLSEKNPLFPAPLLFGFSYWGYVRAEFTKISRCVNILMPCHWFWLKSKKPCFVSAKIY